MVDEEFYVKAKRELDSDDRDSALWTKALTLAEGNEERASFQYIKLRVEQLNNADSLANSKEISNNTKTIKSHHTVNNDADFNIKYISVAEFASIKSMYEERVIELIKEGFYVGQIKNGEWYISRKELGEDISSASPPPISTGGKFIPIHEFSEHMNLPVNEIIKMIRNGDFQGQLIDGEWYVPKSQLNTSQNNSEVEDKLISFTWWNIWGWMGLILGNLYILASIETMPELTITLLILNTILMVMILKYNKYAFLIATVLSLNPLLWIINGIYLKNRWGHQKVN